MSAKNGGLSKARLQRMHEAVEGYVASGHVVGAITAIERKGETVVDVVGLQDREAGTPLARDTIFRIASMSKPITAVAAMILVEEGKLSLLEPVDRLLPELADRKVLKDLNGPIDDVVPANRPITLRDLLTFRMGFGMIMAPPGQEPPIQKAMMDRGIMSLNPGPKHTPDAWIAEFGKLPLMHQPGEKWMYHTGSDVAGVLIARAAGAPLETFLKERIFEPLGMKDTGFHVPAKKLDRLAACYGLDERQQLSMIDPGGEKSNWATPPNFPMAGGGLVSTVDDYLAFGRMMLNGGKLKGERILSRPSVLTMTTDQLTEEQKRASPVFSPGFWDAQGWGFGVSVGTRRLLPHMTPGRFGWDGAFGTSWASDPAEDMISVLMIQRMGMGPQPGTLNADFWTLAYQCIDD